MADFYSDIAATQNTSVGSHQRVNDSRSLSGIFRRIVAKVDLTAAVAAADQLFLAKLPTGALIFPSECYVVSQVPAAADAAVYVELDLGFIDYTDGTADDTTALVNGLPVRNGGIQRVLGDGGLWTVKSDIIALGGGAAAEAETSQGVLTTDHVYATPNTIANAVSFGKAVPTANTVTYTFSADPGVSTVATTVKREVAQEAEHYDPVAVASECWLAATVAAETAIEAKQLTFVIGYLTQT
jgi:hypothetical protein